MLRSEKTISISLRVVVQSIAGQLYAQAPAYNPRKSEIIMKKVVENYLDFIRSKDSDITDDIIFDKAYNSIPEKNLVDFIKSLIWDIPEFKELNLSQREYENNISVDDPNRSKYRFVTRYDVDTMESIRDDFIDLDAFLNNIIRNIYMITEAGDDDCFLCNYDMSNLDNKPCENCKRHYNDLEDLYESNREPRGNHKLSCENNCWRGFYICCTECNRINCKDRCSGNPDNCGNVKHDMRNMDDSNKK